MPLARRCAGAIVPGLVLVILVPCGSSVADNLAGPPGVVLSEYLYEQAPFPQCHASTIAETPGGLVAAWFGGAEEGANDVGIWLSRRQDGEWSAPMEVARGERDGKPLPCWNPVLHRPTTGPLLLFYKVGPTPREWWGMLTTSDDDGKTWSPSRRLPDGILGPIKNKPITLPDGGLLCPSSTEDKGWRVHFERTKDLGRTWERIGPINDGRDFAAIQPTILVHPDGRLQALCRSRQSRIVESQSDDGGATWSPLAATTLPNPDSGIDAVSLADGRHLLVSNPVERGRSPLIVSISDDGKAWKLALTLEDEPGEFSYPAVIQSADGLVHLTYTWNRRKVRHVVLDPAKLVPRPVAVGR